MTTDAGSRSDTAVRMLGPGDERSLRALLAADPVAHCFAEARLDATGLGSVASGGPFWGFERQGRLTAALLVGANLVPVATDEESRAAFAERALRQPRRSSSIVGPAAEVLDLWARLAPHWGPAREVRPHQHLMVATEPAQVPADPGVRLSRPDDLAELFPACVAMFTEEVGVSPVAGGLEFAYRRRIADLIEQGRSCARFEEGRPVFKAEVGALSSRACQIQGVWVHPERRGRGLAAPGMAAVVDIARTLAPLVSLYVNDYNAPAVAAYRRAGFTTVGRFATVLF